MHKNNAKYNNSAYLLGLLLELLHRSLVDSTALVDEMASGGRLARVYVANDHNVDVNLVLAHDCWISLLGRFCRFVSLWLKHTIRNGINSKTLGQNNTQTSRIQPTKVFAM